MAYQLHVRLGSGALHDLASVRDVVGGELLAHESRIRVDGDGFRVEWPADPRGGVALLDAGPRRGVGDERAMELASLHLARPDGDVLDRHTGRRWTVELLAEWLPLAGLLSGRVLAANEARIAHASVPDALAQFAESVAALVTHARDGGANAGFTSRLRDELAVWALRPPLAVATARALAALGDFDKLEAMTRTRTMSGDLDAFEIAAQFGAASLPLFERALEDPDPNHRRAAARWLHRIADARVLPLVARALGDRRSTVRDAVLENGFDAVLALPDARTVLGAALDLLRHDSSSLVRRHARRFRE